MATLQELRDRRAAAWAQAQEFNSRATAGEELSGEDETGWRNALSEVDTLGEQIATRERTEELDASFRTIDDQTEVVTGNGDATATRDEYRAAFEQYVRGGMPALTAEQRSMLEANERTTEDRAQSAGTGSEGGYTVPEGFWAKVTETMKLFGGAEVGAEVINTSTGQNLPWPTNDDTSNTGEMLDENTAAAEGDVTFGQKTLGVYTFSSKQVRVSTRLLRDTGIDIESFLARKLGERLARAQAAKFTLGTGSGQPQGFITGTTSGKTAASATAITYDELIDLEHSVDAAYRASGRARYKFNDATLATLRKVRDDSGGAGEGRPLWQPSIQAGVPNTFNGYAYDIVNEMATIAASAKTVAFGDFTAGFVVRHVGTGSLLRLVERYAEYGQVGFLAFDDADSLVQDASAIKYLTQASS